MLTCLTLEDAQRLLRKSTQKDFFTQLMAVLRTPAKELVLQGEADDWRCIQGSNHQLTRSSNAQGELSQWATWFDVNSMYPLLMASWYWWQPILQGAVTALTFPQARSQSLSLVGCDSDCIWAVVAAIYTCGVDEVVIDSEQSWQALLAPLPVTVQQRGEMVCLDDCWQLPLSLDAIQPVHWYQLFRLLNRLCDELCAGHRVDFSQKKQSADQVLSRLLTY